MTNYYEGPQPEPKPITDAERAEAADPTTSWERLVALLHRGLLEEVLGNPALLLVLMETPDFWNHVDRELLGDIARSPRCPASLLVWTLHGWRRDADGSHSWEALGVVRQGYLNPALDAGLRRECLLAFPCLPGDAWLQSFLTRERPVIAPLLTPLEWAWVDEATRGVPLRPAALEGLLTLGRLGLGMALQAPGFPEALLAELWPQIVEPELALALSQERAPAAGIAAALAHPRHAKLACERVRLTPAQFEDFFESTGLRWELALNPHLPRTLMDRIARGPSAHERRALTMNPSLPEDLQRALARDPDRDVRESMANQLNRENA